MRINPNASARMIRVPRKSVYLIREYLKLTHPKQASLNFDLTPYNWFELKRVKNQ